MTRRKEIVSRISEIDRTISEAIKEKESLTNELTTTPGDLLDMDSVQAKNDFLKRMGLLPQD